MVTSLNQVQLSCQQTVPGALRQGQSKDAQLNHGPEIAFFLLESTGWFVIKLPFPNRSAAGRLLGAELASRKHAENAIVLALPRGGVPVAVEVAEALHAPLDVIVVRKLGVPWQPELAMGAIARGTPVLDRALIRSLEIGDHEVEAVIARETEEMERREAQYRRDLPQHALRGRTVILVDDGLATGSTMLAAARHARAAGAKQVIAAVPVGSIEACRRLSKELDDCVCLAMPEQFYAVGQWYDDFQQVTDAEVHQMLQHIQSRLEVPE